MHSPFAVDNDSGFQRWSDWKRARVVGSVDDAVVEVADAARLSCAEVAKLTEVCARSNFVVYRSARSIDEVGLLALGESLGLVDLNRNLCAGESGVSALRVVEGGVGGEYIPYTDRSLNWHTDGYYNGFANPIRGFVLHCVRPAREGGGNQLIDPEMLYLYLRANDPDAIEQLARPDAMTVPPNRADGKEIRSETVGPVYWADARSGDLLTRYTARKRHIRWLDSPQFERALSGFEGAIDASSVPVYRYRLEQNEGLICNNVLHTRMAFEDHPEGAGRCLLRARYHNRVARTGISETFLTK